MSHDGSTTLTRHVLNARRRVSRSGVSIAKEHPGSPRKIDAAMAAVLAYEARADAVATGVGAATKQRSKRLHRF
jgi:phage terminase large subunit-like protein